MAGISGVSSGVNYGSFASGKKINTAADGAAESAIIQKTNAQVGGLNKGSENISSGQEAIKIADGALSTITDSLQRMRELGIQASNGLMSKDDKRAIQDEIDQLKEDIGHIAGNAKYNETNLLDGTSGDINIVTNGNPDSKAISGMNATLDALGIKDFDVTGDFDLKTIDNAMSKVSEMRSSAGAQSNALDHAYAFNQLASYNTTAAQSRLEDLDIPKAISDMKKQETLNNYQMMMQKKKMEDEQNAQLRLFQ